jgi:two-component system OmpR family response regulator
MADPITILCVEDDPDQRVIIARSLQIDPHVTVLMAGSATEALAVAPHLRPDLVLIDNWLPDFGGIELARRLRASGYAGSMIFLTGTMKPSDRAAIPEGLVLGIIAKPFDPVTLAAHIRAMMDGGHGRAPAS